MMRERFRSLAVLLAAASLLSLGVARAAEPIRAQAPAAGSVKTAAKKVIRQRHKAKTGKHQKGGAKIIYINHPTDNANGC